MSSIGSFHDKVYTYVDNNPDLAEINKIPLWNGYVTPTPKAESYAKKIVNSPINPTNLGIGALLLYGQLTGDSPYITLSNDSGESKVFELVSNPYEYYFTDMVFIQQKYEEAIIDLYTYKVCSFYINNDKHAEFLAKIDKAIDDTCLLAQENGININKDEVFAKFKINIDFIITDFIGKLCSDLSAAGCNVLVSPYNSAIYEYMKDFYLNPSTQTYQKVIYAIQTTVETAAKWYIRDLIDKPASGYRFLEPTANDIAKMEKSTQRYVECISNIIDKKLAEFQLFIELP